MEVLAVTLLAQGMAQVGFVGEDDSNGLLRSGRSMDAHVGYKVACLIHGFKTFEGDVLSTREFDQVLHADRGGV